MEKGATAAMTAAITAVIVKATTFFIFMFIVLPVFYRLNAALIIRLYSRRVNVKILDFSV